MKLYFFIVAPNPTRVRLYLEEKRNSGVAIELEEVLVNLREGEQRLPEHLARNARGKVPVLELDDGSFIAESLPIIEYFEELYPEPAMIGGDPLERVREREVERIAELGVLAPIATIVHATNSPLGLPPSPPVAEHAREILPVGVKLLDDRLSDGRELLMGSRPSVADCTLAAALQFGRFGKVELPEGFAHLERWDQRFRERDSAKTVLVG